MRKIVIFTLTIAIFLIFLVTFATYVFRVGLVNVNGFEFIANLAGLGRIPHEQSLTFNAAVKSVIPGVDAIKDNFPIIQYRTADFTYEQVEAFEEIYGTVKQTDIQVDSSLKYKNSFIELPLYAQDYYYRKYENGVAGINGINKVPVLKPGDRIALIKNMYINVKPWNGFVQPPGYYFGSGLCWSTSTLGYLMDQANKNFQAKYGLALFTFRPGDRAPHDTWYRTYGLSNNGWGYTVLQISTGNAAQDYRFTVNPDIAKIPELADLQIKIMMIATTNHPTASHGQSLGGYILSNKQF